MSKIKTGLRILLFMFVCGVLLSCIPACDSEPPTEIFLSDDGGSTLNVQVEHKVNWPVISKVIAAAVVVIAYIVITFVVWNRRLAAEIDERKRTEKELLASRQRLELSMQCGKLGFWDLNLKSKVAVFNERFAEIMGYTLAEIPKKSSLYLESIYQADRDNVLRRFNACVNGETSDFTAEYRVVTKQGRIRWMVSKGAVVERDKSGKAVRMVGVVSDFTKRKQAEAEVVKARDEALKARRAADQANKAKSYFLANMSHEIRTPMNAIMGMAYLVGQTDLTPRQSRYISKISAASKALLRIINDILDFSKIEAGKLEMENVAFDLQTVLDNVGDLIAVRATDKPQLELLFEIEPDVPLSLKGDPLRLSQILTNLAGNSVKFTDEGEVVVKVSLESKTDERCYLKFSVRDTGIGMSKEQQQNLFKAFSQADGSTTRKYGGTGLGLSICKRLVEMMGGEIEVISEPGKGSEFYFVIPFERSKTTTSMALTAPGMKGLKALVIDDNPTSRLIIVNILRSFEFTVTEAKSLEEGLALLSVGTDETAIRLVVMDANLKGYESRQQVDLIRKTVRGRTPPAVIAVGTSAMLAGQDQTNGTEPDGFVAKPVNPSTLFDAIAEALHIVPLNNAPINPAGSAQGSGSYDLSGVRILLAEDNDINQEVAREILQNAGAEVTVAVDGKQAVKMVESQPYDVVLMDIQMPEMSGLDATQYLRNKPEFRRLPIIAMTANAMESDRRETMQAGMNDHITKPIAPEELLRVVSRWVKPKKRASKPRQGVEIHMDMAAAGLPESHAINTADGLNRVGGNLALYKKLLQKFRKSHINSGDKIAAMLAAENYEATAMLVHTIKGVAANLGAQELPKACENLESVLKEDNSAKYDTELLEFQRALKVVIDLISEVDKSLPEKGGDDTGPAVGLPDRKKLKMFVAEIGALLRESDMEAIDKITASREIIGQKAADELEALVSNYDFDGALKTLNRLVEKYG